MGSSPSKKTEAIKEKSPRSSTSSSSSANRGSNDHIAQIDSKAAPNSQAMPFFRKQSDSAKKRLQHQQYLARESPEPTFDISGCELGEIPSGVYSLCKVLQKEALLAHHNWLSSLKGGGKLADLCNVRVLDLHHNEIGVLPDDISHAKCLQVLNLESNKIKSLPSTIGKLQMLQTLNVRDNKLKEIPESISDMQHLRTIDISKNRVDHLPRKMCLVKTLENVILDVKTTIYPPADVCDGGTESIMKFLCNESSIEYTPPGKFLLDVLDGPRVPESRSNYSLDTEYSAVTSSVMEYENLKEKKRRERVALERHLEEEQRQQARLALTAASNKEHLVQFVAQNAQKLDGELKNLQQQKEAERLKLLRTLQEVEDNSSRLVEELLAMNEKARQKEELMDKMERERMEAEQWFIVRQEEMENLRKQEVLTNMKLILSENEEMDKLITKYFANRESFKQKYKKESDDSDGKLELVMGHKDKEQKLMIEHLVKEERLQKEAFEMLQLQKDTRHKRIRGQIEIIQQELAQLTIVEVEQRELKLDVQMNILAEKRIELTELLIQLLGERDKREAELKRRLMEMDQQRMLTEVDYWLVQFQRLMDKKPDSLIDMETHLEYVVVEIVEKARAADYLPTFARHRISIETLCQMDEKDFEQMGVHEKGLRKALLMEIARYEQSISEERAAAKKKLIEEPTETWLVEPPSTSGAEAQKPLTPTAPQDVVARGINSECVVCLDSVSTMLFLNCGHVCCCVKCAEPIKECPLCRSEIVQRIKLTTECPI